MPTSPPPCAAALAALLGLAAACADVTPPAAPYAIPPAAPPGPAAAPPGAGFPELARAGDVYAEAGTPYGDLATRQFHGGALTSRLVLYRDGTFGLQFSSARFGPFEYGGSYVRSGASITFGWAGWSTAGPWGATATVRGDTLRVEYNDIMRLTDFVDGDYVRVAGTP
jgi:hypothetical protein